MKKDEYWKILLKNIDWIKFSDTKAVVILTVYGVLLTIVYSNFEEVYKFVTKSNFSIGVSIITGILSLLSIIFTFLALNPKLKNNNPKSIVYFGHIQEKFSSWEDYYNESKSIIEEDDYEKQLAEQVFVTSQVAWNKFKNVSKSIRCFILALFLILFLTLLYMIG